MKESEKPDQEKIETAIAAMLRAANLLEAEHDNPDSDQYNDYGVWQEYTTLRKVAEWLSSITSDHTVTLISCETRESQKPLD